MKFKYFPSLRRKNHIFSKFLKVKSYFLDRNFLAKLHKRKLGTGEIEAAAKRNIYGEDAVESTRNKAVEKEVVRVLRLRIKTADEKIKMLKNEWESLNFVRLAVFAEEAFRWYSCGKEDPSNWMERAYCQIENDEMREQWEDGKKNGLLEEQIG